MRVWAQKVTVCFHGIMADDDIEKLLREVNSATGAQPPATTDRNDQLPAERSGSGQGSALAIAAVIGVVGLVLGFLPWVPGFWLGLGGFLGAYIALLVGRRLG